MFLCKNYLFDNYFIISFFFRATNSRRFFLSKFFLFYFILFKFSQRCLLSLFIAESVVNNYLITRINLFLVLLFSFIFYYLFQIFVLIYIQIIFILNHWLSISFVRQVSHSSNALISALTATVFLSKSKFCIIYLYDLFTFQFRAGLQS